MLVAHRCWCCLLILIFISLVAVADALGAKPLVNSDEPPVIPVGLDAYRMWDRWCYQRIGARAYMRSTYDRSGGNETADASHFLYQVAEDFNVTLDVEGRGVLYFVRTNHWHGSPWHYEVDGKDHIVQETTTADPTKKLEHSVFIPEHLFPNPLTWTYSITKGADLMWVPIMFENRFRLAYSRTFYGTGYYIYHHYANGANLSQPIRTWDGRTPPDPGVLDLIRAAGTDIAPKSNTPKGEKLSIRETSSMSDLPADMSIVLATLTEAPAMVRALKISVPNDQAVDFGKARIRITWDNRKYPSIDTPIALFFGAGTLHNRTDSEYLVKAFPVNIRFDDKRVYLACYFPMPFFRSAKIELIGPKKRTISDVQWSIRIQPYNDPINHVAYFHATYVDHHDPELGKDNVFLDTKYIEGSEEWSGNFVGTSFIFSDRAVLTTLEGDPRFFFDDSQTSQAYGTGTEEWGGGGDYWGGRNMTLPFAGHPVGVRHYKDAKNSAELIQSAYRFLLADLMPFGKRALIRLEHGGRNDSIEHYQSVTYWYGVPSPTLILTDELNIGDETSEQDHNYLSPDASEPYELTSRYEWGVDTIRQPHAYRPYAQPTNYADFEFQADADKRYFIWLRGKSAGEKKSDSTWLQFDEFIGTHDCDVSYRSHLGFGNWRDAVGSNTWAWSSGLPNKPPFSVKFKNKGLHKLRVQVKNGDHAIDQIWLSATQNTRPVKNDPVEKTESKAGQVDQIILDAGDTTGIHGQFQTINDASASIGKFIKVAGSPEDKRGAIEVYPAHTEVGRKTTTSSEFTLKLRENNLGVLLRRTLDYKFPNQRAKIYVADVGDNNPDWQYAGVWYLAGSNTCYHSYPRKAGELGKSAPKVQTSNRRFRDDEFLIPRSLTEGRSAIRVRVEFTPVKIPLLPDRELDELAWSEIRYQAYCYVMPKVDI
ncbi:MAG: DUF2961 domain-containing protein [Planctomycetota bacterium]|nr:MAG: DUF2961 domain-containing protein [Planctomycetota bacterium]